MQTPRRYLDSDRPFDIANGLLLTVFGLLVLYPLYFVVIASFSDPNLVNSGGVLLYPRGITLEGFKEVFRFGPLWRGYLNTIIYTVSGTALNVALTVSCAYALSRRDFYGRRVITGIFAFTMLFHGGLIPTYLLVRSLGLVDTMWAMILPGAVNFFYLSMCRTFFETTIPDELLEAARIEGSGNLRFFFSIVLPLSPALIAIMVLYYAVGHWNAFFNAFIYLMDRDKYPLQLVLRDIIIMNQAAAADMTTDAESLLEKQKLADLIKYGAIIFSTAPILMFYPFVQRYFVKGVMIGAVKG